MTTTSLALNNGWLSGQATLTNTSNAAVFSNNTIGGWCYGDYWYPWYRPIEHHHHTIEMTRPIRLTMSEVERLRVAAKKDKALKATLEKFTDHIEVVVDFDKQD